MMALLTDLARARAAFQLRTILTVMGSPDQERVKNTSAPQGHEIQGDAMRDGTENQERVKK